MARRPSVAVLKAKGEILYNLRKEIADADEAHRLATAEKKARRDQLSAEMIADFKAIGLSSIKVDSGETVAMAKRTQYVVLNPIHATKWAIERRAVRVDSRLLQQALTRDAASGKEIPADLFKKVEDEYISVRKPKEKKAEGEADEAAEE